MNLICATSLNRVIGFKNSIPWLGKYPDDMRFFKRMTTGHTLIMGRRTFKSVGPLPLRRTLVITRNKRFWGKTYQKGDLASYEYTSMHDVVAREKGDLQDAWVCGGAEIYEFLHPFCETAYITTILKFYRGDTFMPLIEHLYSSAQTILKNDELIITKLKKPCLSH